jgi:hypothetical protein
LSDQDKVHALYQELVTHFLDPLLNGGVAQCTRALPPAALEHFSLARPVETTVEGSILEALARLSSELAPVELVELAERGLMATLMAVHNLYWLTDPELDRAFARGAREPVREWVFELIQAIGMPRTRSGALGRHVILDRALGLEREDTVVKNWAYTYRFYGRPPPKNVVALPKLRFVREDKTQRGLLELALEGTPEVDLETPLRALVARSPITQILHHDLSPNLRFGQASLAVLSDHVLRSGIVQELVKRGTGHVAQPFGHALRVLSAEDPSPQHLFVAVALIAELQILEVLDERAGHRPRSEPAVGDEELFAAVLPALFEIRGPLQGLVMLNPGDAAELRQRAAKLAQQAGDDAVAMARAILERAQPLKESA